MNLVKLILSYLQCEIHRQHTASQLSRQSPFNQKSTKRIISKFLSDFLKNSQDPRKHPFIFSTKNNLQWFYPFSSFTVNLYDIWVNIIAIPIAKLCSLKT
jgi:hypothetical protein